MRAHHRRKGRMPLVCTQPHAGRMHLRLINGRLWAAHYPGEGSTACRVAVAHEAEGLADTQLEFINIYGPQSGRGVAAQLAAECQAREDRIETPPSADALRYRARDLVP
jgi:hypothetical protein